MMNLNHLEVGVDAVIDSVTGLDDDTVRRLYAMGIRPGKTATVIRKGKFNGPLHIKIGTTDLTLRRSLADHVNVN